MIDHKTLIRFVEEQLPDSFDHYGPIIWPLTEQGECLVIINVNRRALERGWNYRVTINKIGLDRSIDIPFEVEEEMFGRKEGEPTTPFKKWLIAYIKIQYL